MADGYFWTPNVDMTDYYSGSMMPPTVSDYNAIIGTPGATGKPRDMSPESIYQSIYGEPLSSSGGGGLTSRKVNTVAIDPSTGMPPRPQVAANPLPQSPNYYNPGNMYKGPGSAAAGPKIGTGPEGNRLTPNAMGYNNNTVNPVTGKFPFNYPPNAAAAAIETAAPRQSLFDPKGGAIGSVADMQGQFGKPSDGIIDLGDSFSPKAGQGFADSEGKPVRIKGVVYYPGGKAPSGKASGTLAQDDTRGPLSKLFGLKTSGLGGLLGGLFSGMNTANAGRAGASTVPGLGGLLSGMGGSAYGSSPSQGQAMIVSPGTSTGSVLSGMGFSDGAAVPAATIRALNDRGYF